MELELKFAELACCEPVGDLITTQEESMETAIPEYCPDIARIVDTVGQLRLREKHPAGQQLTMGGSVVLTVLYTSEESAGLRSLSMEVPFSCQVEDKRLADCDAVCVTGRLLLAEAKAVTARKLYLRVMPEFTVSGYARRRQRLCWNGITRWKAPRWKSTAKRAKRSWSSRITSRRWNIPPQGIVSAWSSACLPHRS